MALLLDCNGRVILTGMGKSGIICRKIAATLACTGTPAFFLHPAEAIHGDLGVMQADDVVVALSYSGETEELLRLLETIKRLGAKLIAITGRPLDAGAGRRRRPRLPRERGSVPAEPGADGEHHRGPRARRRAGHDAAGRKGFRQEDFANLHPGGKLGKRLMRVEQLMHAGEELPVVGLDTAMRDVIYEMSRKGLGMTCVVETDGRLAGIITDGDLRRHMSEPRVLELNRGGGDDAEPGHGGAPRSRRRGAARDGTAEDHRRSSSSTPAGGSKASCTCTTSGGPRCSDLREERAYRVL